MTLSPPGIIIFQFNIIALPPRVCVRGVIFYVHNSIVPEYIRFLNNTWVCSEKLLSNLLYL